MNFGYMITDYVPVLIIAGSIFAFIMFCSSKGDKGNGNKSNNTSN